MNIDKFCELQLVGFPFVVSLALCDGNSSVDSFRPIDSPHKGLVILNESICLYPIMFTKEIYLQ